MTLSVEDRERLENAALTYPRTSMARAGGLTSRYRSFSTRTEIGSGSARLDQASGTLLGWQMHRNAGLAVRASSERVAEGAVAIIRLSIGPFGVDAPVRVLYVVDEPRRRGFAYGTLPGHPESGEEEFMLELRDDETVDFTISAVSRAASPIARLGGPLTRAVQSRVTERYLSAV